MSLLHERCATVVMVAVSPNATSSGSVSPSNVCINSGSFGPKVSNVVKEGVFLALDTNPATLPVIFVVGVHAFASSSTKVIPDVGKNSSAGNWLGNAKPSSACKVLVKINPSPGLPVLFTGAQYSPPALMDDLHSKKWMTKGPTKWTLAISP